jgi:hypothetical protein
MGVHDLNVMMIEVSSEPCRLKNPAPRVHACGRKNSRLTMAFQSFQLRARLQAAHVNFKPIFIDSLGRFHDLPLRAGVMADGVT